MTILVVEDDPLVADAVADMIQSLGHHVLTVESADRALSLIETGSTTVTHVLADVNMAGELNGLTLARLLSTLYPAIAVVITSGDPSVRDPAAEHELRCIPKPWTMAELAMALEPVSPGRG